MLLSSLSGLNESAMGMVVFSCWQEPRRYRRGYENAKGLWLFVERDVGGR